MTGYYTLFLVMRRLKSAIVPYDKLPSEFDRREVTRFRYVELYPVRLLAAGPDTWLSVSRKVVCMSGKYREVQN